MGKFKKNNKAGKFMEKFLDNTSDAVIKYKIIQSQDAQRCDLQIVYANKKVESITNVKNELIINNSFKKVFPKLANSLFDWTKIFIEAAMTNDSKIIEQYFDVFEKYLRLNIFGYKDDCFYVIITDLTEKKEIRRQILVRDRQIKHLETELKARANVDVLTGTYNFQFIIDNLVNSIENYKKEDVKFCVFVIDIDGFKKINKTFGIKMGDVILQKIALLVKSSVRKIDIAGRNGSDEFIIILNNLDVEIAKIIVERFKQDIEKDSMKIANLKLSVSGALIEYQGETIENFLNKVEMKVKKAKSLGKGYIIS